MSDPIKSVEILQSEVDQVKTDLDDLKTEANEKTKKDKTEAAAKKMKTTKEEINKKIEALKGLGEENNQADILKLEAMLVTLNTSNSELNTLKGDITDPILDSPEEDEKKKTPEDRNRLEKQRDGITSKKEWKENTLTNIARAVSGTALIGGAIY